ncbi:peptidase inhibitor family I36 protein [Streptomyces sp. NBC_00690]|uniref:peptidase inhibitor family I36 protein n=1 Tax=Streptomyces sp. NBC_00690 TaxID=2975808 RepID=UPI002E28CD1F|nr:peptidase inhibitor family I36 protein [Streptomyces sp. NBC_00690]
MTALVAAVCAGAFMAPTPAGAAPAAERKSHCVADSGTQRITCYDTFRESIAAATEGRITDAPAPWKAAKDQRFMDRMNAVGKARDAAAATGARVRLEAGAGTVLFEHAQYQGGTLTIRTSHGGHCKSDGKWDGWASSLTGHWINNQISSLWTLNKCYVDLFQDANFQGPNQFHTKSTEWVGDAMNDTTSSVALT